MLSFLCMSQDPNTSFSAFVMSLAATAAVHLGDLGDPTTGATHKDVPAAGHIIDLLAMLQQKTTGNLDAEESHLLDQVLYELRMRYVELSGGAPAGEQGSGGGQEDRRIIADDGPRIIIP
jgi:Domain of unknown function (DUF1844)